MHPRRTRKSGTLLASSLISSILRLMTSRERLVTLDMPATLSAHLVDVAATQRTALDDEASELQIAQRVAERLEPRIQRTVGAMNGSAAMNGTGEMTADGQVIPASIPSSQPVTQAEMIVATLRTAADPWFSSSAALREEIFRIHGVRIKDNSFYPVVNGLKGKGTIVRKGAQIALTDRVPSDESFALQLNEIQHGSDLP